MSNVLGGVVGNAARVAKRALLHTVSPAGPAAPATKANPAGQVNPAQDAPDDPAQWGVITVDLPQEQVLPAGRWPNPLAVWGDAIEVQVRPAPGARCSQLYARLRDPRSDAAPEGLDGETPAQKLRTTLRRSKQLLEA